MIYFAHNGVDHATATQAAVHSSGDKIVIVILVSAVIAGMMAAATYALRRFDVIKLPRDKEVK